MNLKDFKEYVEKCRNVFLNRGNLINILSTSNSNWSFILRALLICSSTHIISKQYLIHKLDFMLDNPDTMSNFMDFSRYCVYMTIKDCLGKK